jgi:hypothetical protein
MALTTNNAASFVKGGKDKKMAELKQYVVTNRKKFGDAAAKKKFQFEFKGTPQKAGDILKLDPNAIVTRELVGAGYIKAVEDKPKIKLDPDVKDKAK